MGDREDGRREGGGKLPANLALLDVKGARITRKQPAAPHAVVKAQVAGRSQDRPPTSTVVAGAAMVKPARPALEKRKHDTSLEDAVGGFMRRLA